MTKAKSDDLSARQSALWALRCVSGDRQLDKTIVGLIGQVRSPQTVHAHPGATADERAANSATRRATWRTMSSDLVDGLDLTAFYALYEGDGRRNAPYEPRMMVKVLLYAYATGVFSSRRVARKLEEDVAFRVLAAGNFPQHRTPVRVSASAPGGFPGAVRGGGPSGAGVGSGALGEAVD